MAATRIKDSGDPRVAPYTSIKERDLTGRGDRFIVEGKVTLETLVRKSRFEIESVFVADTKLDGVASVLERLGDRAPVYTASRETFDAIAGFPVHRGVLACAKKGVSPALSDMTDKHRLVVAIGLSNHDNVGALFRNAAAFGADAVVLDGESCDPLYRKSIRVSAGAALWMPFVHGPSADTIIQALSTAGHRVWALTPRTSAHCLWDLQVPSKLALLLGAEGPGLSETLIRRAQPVRIPMTDGFDSVNVATAAAIAMAHAFAARSQHA